MPSINLGVVPPPITAGGMAAKLDINGTVVESKSGSNAPVAVPWPGAGTNRTAITVGPDQSPQPQQPQRPVFGGPPPPQLTPPGEPSVLERQGPWSLFRMLDAASPTRQGDRIVATFIVGGTTLQFLQKYHDRVASVHLKDRTTPEHGAKNLPWGTGDTPLKEILQLAKSEKYTLPLSVELEYEVPQGSDAVKEVRRCLDYCRAVLAS